MRKDFSNGRFISFHFFLAAAVHQPEFPACEIDSALLDIPTGLRRIIALSNGVIVRFLFFCFPAKCAVIKKRGEIYEFPREVSK